MSISAGPGANGGIDNVVGRRLPALALTSSRGDDVHLDDLGPGLTVLYAYPMTGRPGTDPPEGWNEIPGARGCTSEACSFRDHFRDLQAAGATRVFGLSSQLPDYQAEVVDRLHLPFAMLSDPDLRLADALQLPTFNVSGRGRLYKRLTLIVSASRIEHVFHPILDPDWHADQVLSWLRSESHLNAALFAGSQLQCLNALVERRHLARLHYPYGRDSSGSPSSPALALHLTETVARGRRPPSGVSS